MCSMWSSARGGWWLPWSSPNTCLRAVQCPGREPLRNCQHQVLHQSDLDDGGWGQDHHNLAVSCFDMILPQSAQSVSWEVSLVHSWRQRGTFKFLPNKDQEELPAHKYIPVQGSLVQRGQYHQGRHDQVKLVPELSLHPHTGDNHGSLSLLSTKVRIVRDCAGAIGMGLAMGLMGSTAARYRHKLWWAAWSDVHLQPRGHWAIGAERAGCATQPWGWTWEGGWKEGERWGYFRSVCLDILLLLPPRLVDVHPQPQQLPGLPADLHLRSSVSCWHDSSPLLHHPMGSLGQQGDLHHPHPPLDRVHQSAMLEGSEFLVLFQLFCKSFKFVLNRW